MGFVVLPENLDYDVYLYSGNPFEDSWCEKCDSYIAPDDGCSDCERCDDCC